MDVYIIRHGAASEIDNEISVDSYRYLTVHGRNHCRIVARRLKDMNVEFDSIISSPLVRAVQTAEVFAEVMKYSFEIKTSIELIGGNSYTMFIKLLKRHSHNSRIAIFGHAPDVNIYTMSLLRNNPVKDLQLNFKYASVCKVKFDPESENGMFVWFLNSENMKLKENNK